MIGYVIQCEGKCGKFYNTQSTHKDVDNGNIDFAKIYPTESLAKRSGKWFVDQGHTVKILKVEVSVNALGEV